MQEFELYRRQFLPVPLGDVFAFFSDATNLARITPDWLRFDVRSPQPIEMRVGTRIDYTIRVRGIPMKWQSEITVWEPPFRFVDEQRAGPYRYWIHEHTFEDLAGGTTVSDRVHYAVPGGRLVHFLFVRRDLDRIFSFRREALDRIFTAPDSSDAER